MADVFDATANAILGDEAAPYALIESADRSVGGILFDVTVREVLSDESVITVNPIQTGSPVSDHVFDQPSVIEITAASSDSTAGYVGYAQTVYEQLLALKATKLPFDVSTGKRNYTGMLFSNITVVTDSESEFALMVTARLQQVTMTTVGGSTGLVAANQADAAATAPTVDMGMQTLQPVSGGIGADFIAASTGSTGSGGTN